MLSWFLALPVCGALRCYCLYSTGQFLFVQACCSNMLKDFNCAESADGAHVFLQLVTYVYCRMFMQTQNAAGHVFHDLPRRNKFKCCITYCIYTRFSTSRTGAILTNCCINREISSGVLTRVTCDTTTITISSGSLSYATPSCDLYGATT